MALKHYVAGFLFNHAATEVVLIRKINPAWQRGHYNAVGGKIEPGESAIDAMVREFEEETGVLIPASSWTHYAHIHRPTDYHLQLFFAHSDQAYDCRTVEQEIVARFAVSALPDNLISNLRWLIPLALDQHIQFNQPIEFTEPAHERSQV
ncbi:NUDIX hydrolase [uncultured Ferrimonas sp.]|uniref:NUDIX hydrolase n=1 Tax=uncultured Ferrimonas sp. TaxID=432640 RepID=UPI002635E183|nr:NUDIX hydrolase [uncultured Ferrimonas sp.]